MKKREEWCMPTQTLRHTALLTGVKFWSINCLHFQVPKLKLLKVELSLEMYWNVFVKCRDNGHLMRAFFKNIPKNELWGIWGTSSSSYQAPFCHWVSLFHEFLLINKYFYFYFFQFNLNMLEKHSVTKNCSDLSLFE